MDRNTFHVVAAIGALVHGALYLAGVFIAALMTHNATAGQLAIATAGVTYLSFIAHLSFPPSIATMLTMFSIVFGVVAGICLVT